MNDLVSSLMYSAAPWWATTKASLSVSAGSILEAKPSWSRELGLVFVDRARQLLRGRRRHLGLRDQQPLQPDGVEIVVGNRRRGGQRAGRQRFLVIAGLRRASAFDFVDRVQGEAATLGDVFVALVLHDRRGVRDGDRPRHSRRKREACRASNWAAPAAPARPPRSRPKSPACCGRRPRHCRRRTARRSSFFSSASDLIFLLPGLIRSSTSCSRMASARARGGTLASVRSTARSACRWSNRASALALSVSDTILRRSRELLLLRTAASRAAKRASTPLASPTANTRVSEFRSQIRPPRTTQTVRIKVRTANSTICCRLFFATCERPAGLPGCGVGASALMAHTRTGKVAVGVTGFQRRRTRS